MITFHHCFTFISHWTRRSNFSRIRGSIYHPLNQNIPQSIATNPFPFSEIDMLASHKPFVPIFPPLSLRPLHAKIPPLPPPSFVYLPVSSSRLLAFSSLSSANVCVRVRRRRLDSNGLHEYRAYQLLFLRRTTPMNNAFPGKIDMQIAKCSPRTRSPFPRAPSSSLSRPLPPPPPATPRIWVTGISSLSFFERETFWRGREGGGGERRQQTRFTIVADRIVSLSG